MLCLKKKFKSDVLPALGEGPAATRARCYFPPDPLLQLRAPHGAELGAPAPPQLGSPHPAELWGWSTGKSPGSGDVTEGAEPPPAGQTKALLILHAASRCAALQPGSIQRRWSPFTPPKCLPNLLYAPKTHGRVFPQAKPDAHPAPSPPCTPDPNLLRGRCSAAAPPLLSDPPRARCRQGTQAQRSWHPGQHFC